MMKGCCVLIRYTLGRNCTKDKKIKANASWKKNVIDKSNMNNFLATINCNEELQSRIDLYNFSIGFNVVRYNSKDLCRYINTLRYSHRELQININVENQHSGRKASCGYWARTSVQPGKYWCVFTQPVLHFSVHLFSAFGVFQSKQE